jgi:hypothetical protein
MIYSRAEVKMFDNLRDSAESPFYEEDPNDLFKEPEPQTYSAPPALRNNGRFLGMTAQQRFIISLMVFFTICILGTFAMFVLGRMSLF